MLRGLRRLAVLAAGLVVGASAALAWAGPTMAAVADVWAFAYLDNPSPPPGWIMDTARQSGTFKTLCPNDWITATSVATGVYRVSIPCSATAGGVVHVTAVDGTASCSTCGQSSARTSSPRSCASPRAVRRPTAPSSPPTPRASRRAAMSFRAPWLTIDWSSVDPCVSMLLPSWGPGREALRRIRSATLDL